MVLQLENMPKVEALRQLSNGHARSSSPNCLQWAFRQKLIRAANASTKWKAIQKCFYVHISPVNGRVLLIGIWPKSVISAMNFHATQAA